MMLTVSVRASPQEQTGAAGANEVSSDFERIGWGPVKNPEHDLGTDLFVMARDARRFDLGLVVGVQVKAGPSHFKRPARDETGAECGWWFSDDDARHVDYWLSHSLPHLVVLHDMDTRISYWAHVTPKSVEHTGKGAKVFIPKDNTIDVAHRDALLEVAATFRPTIPLEGSAWVGTQTLPPKDVLRHALVVPRLIAPHPNAGLGTPITPEQGVALPLKGDWARFDYFARQHTAVPSLEEASASDDWAWRFVGALGHRLLTGEIDKLKQVVGDGSAALAQRVAATIVTSATLIECGNPGQAIRLLETELNRDEAEPVDHAWLRLQHARACVEVGRTNDAREDAAYVQRLRMTSPDDITATAIAGVAAMIVFSTSSWGERNVEAVIRGTDTAATWWRTQAMAWGLSAFVDQSFDAWAQDTTEVLLGGRSPVDEQLMAVTLAASYLGDHGAWRHAESLLARHRLMQLDHTAKPDHVRGGLDILRRAGAEAEIARAVRRIVANGPATAITLATADVELDKASRTTAPADLALIQYGGELLDEATAIRSVAWLLATLEDSSAFRARTSPSYIVTLRLIDTLSGVVPAVPPEACTAVIDYLMALPVLTDQAHATSWARVMDALPKDSWNADVAQRLLVKTNEAHSALRNMVRSLAAPFDSDARESLMSEIRSGSLSALAAFGKVGDLPDDVAAALIPRVEDLVGRQVNEAHRGVYGHGGPDVGRDLALLNVRFPDHARWDPLFTLLSDPAVAAEHKAGALQVLAVLADDLKTDIRTRLGAMALALAKDTRQTQMFRRTPEASVRGYAAHLAIALETIGEEAAAEHIMRLSTGTVQDRVLAARIACHSDQLENPWLCITLSQDPDPRVRANTAAAIATLVAAGEGGDLAVAAFQSCLTDSGTYVARAIAEALTAAATLAPIAQDALATLHNHPSARVRDASYCQSVNDS